MPSGHRRYLYSVSTIKLFFEITVETSLSQRVRPQHSWFLFSLQSIKATSRHSAAKRKKLSLGSARSTLRRHPGALVARSVVFGRFKVDLPAAG